MRIPQKITMREVAGLAGVSPSTVSAVLNGNVLVSKERTLRVQNAIKALGFELNNVARILKTGRTNTVGSLFRLLESLSIPTCCAASKTLLAEILHCSSEQLKR